MSSEWINHDGGDMPEWLTDEFIIETECRYLGCKSRHTLHGKPSDFGWPHGRAEDEGYDPIIRFRVVAEE